jgi:hypothetical protein
MKNKLFLAAACVVLFSTCESTSYSPTSYNPTPDNSTPDRSNYYYWLEGTVLGEDTQYLQGSIWTKTNLHDGYTCTMEFRPGGNLVSTGSSNNTWHRSGTLVEILTSDGYALLSGTIDSETQRISGTGKNAKGTTWEFIMTLSSAEMMQADAQQKAYERQQAQQEAQRQAQEAQRQAQEAQRRNQERESENLQKIQDNLNDAANRLNQYGRDLYNR